MSEEEGRRFRIRHAIAAVAISAVVTGPAYSLVCASADEHLSLGVRELQTRLMVAALSCGQRQQYNAFVVKFRPALAEHGQTLKSYFRRAYGPSSRTNLNRYVTDLANGISARSIADRPAFCAESRRALTTLLNTADGGLEGLAVQQGLPRQAPAGAEMCDAISHR